MSLPCLSARASAAVLAMVQAVDQFSADISCGCIALTSGAVGVGRARPTLLVRVVWVKACWSGVAQLLRPAFDGLLQHPLARGVGPRLRAGQLPDGRADGPGEVIAVVQLVLNEDSA